VVKSSLRSSLVLCTLSVIALSGCFRTEVILEVVSVERTDVSLIVAVDTEKLTTFANEIGGREQAAAFEEMSGEELVAELAEGEDACSGVVGSLDFQVSEYVEGNYRGVICTARKVVTRDVMAEIFNDPEAIREDPSDGSWVLDAKLTDALSLAGDIEEMAGLQGSAMFDPADLLEFRLSISAPGSVSEHNGTSLNGARVTWLLNADAEFVEGSDAVLRARWTPDSGGLGLLVAIALSAVIAAVTLTVAGRTRLRR
jgi:hypothetical protein